MRNMDTQFQRNYGGHNVMNVRAIVERNVNVGRNIQLQNTLLNAIKRRKIKLINTAMHIISREREKKQLTSSGIYQIKKRHAVCMSPTIPRTLLLIFESTSDALPMCVYYLRTIIWANESVSRCFWRQLANFCSDVDLFRCPLCSGTRGTVRTSAGDADASTRKPRQAAAARESPLRRLTLERADLTFCLLHCRSYKRVHTPSIWTHFELVRTCTYTFLHSFGCSKGNSVDFNAFRALIFHFLLRVKVILRRFRRISIAWTFSFFTLF